MVSVVDQEHGAAIEAVPLESIDDFSQRVDLGEQNGDLVDQKTFAVVQKRGQNGSEIIRLDLPPTVLVLGHVILGHVVPNLLKITPRMCGGER